jgi:hypothetical protein
MEAPVAHGGPQVRPLRREEYHRLVELGMFPGERVELFRGKLVEISPQRGPHAQAVESLNEILMPRLLRRARVRIRSPFLAADESEPEPDMLIAPPESTRTEMSPSGAGRVRIAPRSTVRSSV